MMAATMEAAMIPGLRIPFAFAFVLIGSAATAAAPDLPARKPGLWQLTMNFEGRNLPSQIMKHCIDAATDKEMSGIGGGMQKEVCSKQDVQRAGNTVVIDSVCKFGTMTSASHAVVSGDFNSAYTVKVDSKRDGAPPMPGMAAGGTTHMTIEAKWLGACEAGQKPGDMIMGNGMKINVKDMPAMRGGGMPGGPPGMPPAR
jgi:hypothetical protein